MDRIEKFQQALAAVSAHSVRMSPDGLEEGMVRYLSGAGIRRVTNDSALVLLNDLEHVDDLTAECGVTDAAFGVVSTGTLGLIFSPRHRRRTSLVPPVHVAIIRGADLVDDVPAAIRKVGAYFHQPARPSSVVLVTGPSRTADIELKLVLGVHGPRELHVVICGS